MTEGEARALTGKLFAAFPQRDLDPVTVEVYVEALQRLNYNRALEAVNDLIGQNRFVPLVAEIHDAYNALRDRYAQKQLPMPEMTEEEREANVARMREYAASIGRRIPQPGEPVRD